MADIVNVQVQASKKTIPDAVQNFAGLGQILFGVPQEKAFVKQIGPNGRLPDLTYNNAQILQLMEWGSPVKNIPPRKVLRPVLAKYKMKIEGSFRDIMKDLKDHKVSKAEKGMQRLALRIQGWGQKFFTDNDNGWAPNAPSTIRAKGSDRPLIDTGSLRKSITAIWVRSTNG